MLLTGGLDAEHALDVDDLRAAEQLVAAAAVDTDHHGVARSRFGFGSDAVGDVSERPLLRSPENVGELTGRKRHAAVELIRLNDLGSVER